MRSFSSLLLLPLHVTDPQSRLSCRQLQLAGTSASLIAQVTTRFRAWRSVLPELFEVTLREMLRSVTHFSTLLTDLRPADSVTSGNSTDHTSTYHQLQLQQQRQRQVEAVSLSSDVPAEWDSRRLLFSSVIAVSAVEKEGQYLRSKHRYC
jgi:hypothetical protein